MTIFDKTNRYLTCFILFLSAFLSGCNNTQYLEKGQYLYKGATIEIEKNDLGRKKNKQLKEQLALVPRPLPNSSQFKLWVYNTTRYAEQDTLKPFYGKLRRLNNLFFIPPLDSTIRDSRVWLRKRLGQEPVLLDTSYVIRSDRAIKSIVFDKGYFFNTVDYTIKRKNQKASVTYNISLNQPFRINNVYFPTDTTRNIDKELIKLLSNSDLKKGEQFEAAKLQSEINRMVTHLKNNGYYDFSAQYLNFKLDSLHASKTVDLYLNVKTSSGQTDHFPYKLHKVYIMSEYYTDDIQQCCTDTMLYNGYYFVYKDTPYCNPKVVTNYLNLKSGNLYSAQKTRSAQSHLSELGIYKFINIKYDTIKQHQLDCRIYLTPSKRMSISFETEANNLIAPGSSDRSLLGMSVSTSYTNKNLLGNAEAFTSSLSGGVGLNLFSNNTENGQVSTNFIQSVLVNSKTQLTIPKFWVPFKLKNVSKGYRPKTIITGEANYSKRVGFATFGGLGINLGYDWRESSRKRHTLRPISLNLLNVISTEAAFDNIIQQNEFIKRSFRSSVISGANYTYNYSTQNFGQLSSFWSFRGYLETAGNSLNLLDRLLKPTQTFKILGTPYAQYALAEGEVKKYLIFDKEHSLVMRALGGVGVPYGNSTELPYTKQFIVGGANSVRAFGIREIGPGSLPKSINDTTEVSTYDRTGNIRFEANIEYRFPIWYYLKGAVFADAGNVWDLQKSETRPGGAFEPANLLNSIALGAGVGVRLDITFFVFRLDVAFPLRDPRYPSAIPQTYKPQPVLSVGYPF
jgi:outer membrane protein insertion porin family